MRVFLSYLIWPTLLIACISATAWGMTTDYPVLAFNAVYLTLALSLAVLERLMPHERSWLEADGQTFANLAHTLLNKGMVQVIVVVTTIIGVAEATGAATDVGTGLWPNAWPMFFQVLLGLTLAEFGLYWAHRLAHEWPRLWRFHAVHHSVTRLWFINTGRFHFVDTTVSLVLSQPLLFLAGAPLDVLLWVSAVTAFIGMLTHCNVEMRFGPINYFLNTPGLHRWHHSMDPREGNTNYGENLMIFDLLFGTFYNPARRPPATIGIHGPMAPNFLGQLAQPFRPEGLQPSIDEAQQLSEGGSRATS